MTTTSDLSSQAAAGADQITYGAVHLDVLDLDRSLAFWRDLIGLTELDRAADEVRLGVDGRPLIVLHPGAERRPLRGRAGLYHVAIHLPNEQEFARVLARVAAAGVPQAPTDHIFSKATYLGDPDGIQLELTLETPERAGEITVGPGSVTIRDSDGRVRGMTEALDVRDVLSHLQDRKLDRPLPSGTTVGHLHLHVGDLEATRRFYTDMMGFQAHTFVPAMGFADLSAGGRFPHRFAFNVWQGEGAPPTPAGTAGLRFFELIVDLGERAGTRARLDDGGIRRRDRGRQTDHMRPLGQRAPPRGACLSAQERSTIMDVTIIGTGNMARGIGTRLVAGGNSVTLLGTERAKAGELATELGRGAKAGTVGDPIDDVVVLALWYGVARQVAEQYGAQLDGKVVVDISNPIDVETFEPGPRRRVGRRGGRSGGAGSAGRQGVQHDVLRNARVGRGRRAAARRAPRLGRRGCQADRRFAGRELGPARRRRRAAPPRQAARGARVPAHGGAGGTWHRLRKCCQADQLIRRRMTRAPGTLGWTR